MSGTTLDRGLRLLRSPAPLRGVPALILGALGVGLLLPPLFAGLSLPGQRALLTTLITIVLWTTRY
jgi:hypothetical protein